MNPFAQDRHCLYIRERGGGMRLSFFKEEKYKREEKRECLKRGEKKRNG